MANDPTLQYNRRMEIDAILRELCPNVYYEPPEGLKMKYPSIVYERSSGRTDFADNRPYRFNYRYTVTVMTRDPDSTLPDRLAQHQYCTFDRGFAGDNLYHYVFTMY